MTLTIATWNVQNFAEPSGGRSASFVQKLEFIAATLAAVDADVIALQEIIDGNAAGRIATALNEISGASVFTAVNGQADSRDNRVAFVSRLPIVETEPLTAWQLPPGVSVLRLERVAGKIVTVPEATLPRPPLRVRVRLADGTTVDLINAHLKSKLLTFPGGGFSTQDESLRASAALLALERRAAEAMCVRARVDRLLDASQHVVVLGDFNDGPDAATTQLLYGPSGSQPRGPEDATVANRAFQLFDSGDAQRLFNLTKLIPAELRWSRKHDGQGEMLDHILASQGMLPRQGNLRQVPAVNVLNEDVPSILGGQPTAHANSMPDHALVYATFPALN